MALIYIKIYETVLLFFQYKNYQECVIFDTHLNLKLGT